MKKTAVLILAATSLVGCGKFIHGIFGPHLTGSGKLKTETRPVSDFHRIDIGGSNVAEVRVGPKASLEITADDNLLPHIKSRVENGVLVIESEGSFSSEHPAKAVITVPSLDGVQISGASKMSIDGLQTKQFEVELSGASSLTAKGGADSLDISSSGASIANLSAVTAKSAKVAGSGASNLILNAADTIDGELSGASRLSYAGHPKVDVSTSGASEVKGATP